MDLTFTDDQVAISELAGRILGDLLPPEALADIEREGDWFARQAWTELAKADLLGLCLPDDVGGGGYGILEACLVAEQVGRAVAPVPYVPTVVSAAMSIAEHGTTDQRAALLPGVVDGSAILTAALSEPGDVALPAVRLVRAERDGAGWRVRGEKELVPAAHLATHVVVPARADSGIVVLVVPTDADGVTLVRQEAVSLEPLSSLVLDDVRVGDDALLGAPDAGEAVLGRLVDRTVAALCATALGVCDAALRLTARYVSEREQFGTKIGTFQAVAHRCADAYIDTEAVRLTAWQAAWRLAEGLPADEALAVAKYWAAEGSQRVVHAAQHLHGGIGMDTDYPVHRYFRWAKVLELTLGGATTSLLRLGELLAAGPAIEGED